MNNKSFEEIKEIWNKGFTNDEECSLFFNKTVFSCGLSRACFYDLLIGECFDKICQIIDESGELHGLLKVVNKKRPPFECLGDIKDIIRKRPVYFVSDDPDISEPLKSNWEAIKRIIRDDLSYYFITEVLEERYDYIFFLMSVYAGKMYRPYFVEVFKDFFALDVKEKVAILYFLYDDLWDKNCCQELTRIFVEIVNKELLSKDLPNQEEFDVLKML